MGKVRKIALITCGSNFERHKRVVHEVHETLKEMGEYALYVFTNYGIFVNDTPYNSGASSIYQLVKRHNFDGCILGSNVGNHDMLSELAKTFRKCGIPCVGLNVILEQVPFAILDAYSSQVQLMEHLIQEHQCKKINLVGFIRGDLFTEQAVRGYRDVLERYGMVYEEKRVLSKIVSIENGRTLLDEFKERGIDDADATICYHDVHAIGLCLEMKKRGLAVPKDMRLCSLNYSTNSMVFRPVITGINRQDESISRKACRLLGDILDGKEILHENYFYGKIKYGQSCGCQVTNESYEEEIFQEIILNKIESGSQISLMMNYNDALEKVESLHELGNNVFKMLQGSKRREFVFCLNKRDIGYILNETEDFGKDMEEPFDDKMVVISGNLKGVDNIADTEFETSQILPIEPKAGDMYVIMPVHRNERVYGYVTFINSYKPIDMYNHRILHESIGSSIEGLRRQMILRSSIRELDEQHMRDALTGLYNRYAQERYVHKFIESGSFTVVMIDMDGLKVINDTYGHLAGNNALNIMADALKACAQPSDLLVRYAGDEFLILSYTTDCEYWDAFDERINRTMAELAEKQTLSYKIAASVGYSVCNENTYESFVECYRTADKKMYANKQVRKNTGK